MSAMGISESACLEERFDTDFDSVGGASNSFTSFLALDLLEELEIPMPLMDLRSTAQELWNLPSIGTFPHTVKKRCRPCVFIKTDTGCINGASCLFCHLCGREEKRKRKIKDAQKKQTKMQLGPLTSEPQ